jgi:hypothetical protein
MMKPFASCLAVILVVVAACSAAPAAAEAPAQAQGGVPRRLNIAVVTDVHIGESCNGDLSIEKCKPVRALTDAVNRINSMKSIDGVFATGDLTASALTEEFTVFRQIMDGLTMPWWPLLGRQCSLCLRGKVILSFLTGNHDSWPYERHGDTFNQTNTPEGDKIFSEVFGDILSERRRYPTAKTSDWPSGSVVNGDFPQYESWFHNFVVSFPLFSDKLKFLNLDWVAREDALPEPGVGPQAELHDFPGGTLSWLEETLAAQTKDTSFFIMQHHPFHNRLAFSPFGQNKIMNFTFDDVQNKRVQAVMSRYFPSSSFLGVHAGHMHRWFNGTAFTNYTSLDESWMGVPEYETPASKGWWINENYIGSFQVFTFVATSEEDGSGEKVALENVYGMWEIPPELDYHLKPVADKDV